MIFRFVRIKSRGFKDDDGFNKELINSPFSKFNQRSIENIVGKERYF